MDTDLLHEYLGEARTHVLGIIDGLDDAQLHEPVLPSGWSCIGLVNHLAVDVERFWFRAVMADDRTAWASFERSDGLAWEVPADVSPRNVIALYEEEIRRADQIIATTSLDAAPLAWPADQFGSFRFGSLRQLILHVILETACHAGHLDVVRELLDRRQWMVIDAGRPTAGT